MRNGTVIERDWSDRTSETAMEAQKGQKRVSWVERSRIVCRWIGFVERGSAMMGAVEVEWLRERFDRTAKQYGKICVEDLDGVISGVRSGCQV